MIIKSIDLTDVKSYDESSPKIIFQSGVNAIIGENGSGKSTLCEAIGFTLFDFLHPYSQADFTREGKKSGRISVRFQSDHTDCIYRVERGVGHSKYEVFDETNQKKLSLQGKDDVVRWLKDELGIPASMDLQTLWKSSLGVPQGKFTNDFAETPSIRAQLFNPLLEVDVYRDLWKDMKHVVDVFHSKKDTLSDEIVRLEGIVEELPLLKKQVKSLTAQIKSTYVAAKEIDDKIKKTEQQKKILESLQKQIEKMNRDLTGQREKQKDIANQITQTSKQVTDAEKAKDIVKSNVESYESYVRNARVLENLSEKRKEKEALEKKAVALEKKYSLHQEKLARIKEEIQIAKQSKEKMEELKPFVEKQDIVEDQLANLKRKEQDIARFEKEKEQVKEKISDFRQEFQSVHKKIQQISEQKDLAGKKKQLQEQKDELLQQQSVLHHLQEEQGNALTLLENEKESVCPTCNRTLDESHRKEIISQKQIELKHAERKQKHVKKELTTIEQQLQRAVDAEQQVKRLADLTSIRETIQKNADEQKIKKKNLEQQLTILQQEVSEKETLLQRLKRLDDPKQRFQQARVRYEDHKGKEGILKKLTSELETIIENQQKISMHLKEFESVQQQIDSLTEKQKQLQDSYELYLQYKDASSKLGFWKDQLSSLTSLFDAIKKSINSLSRTIEEKKNDFDLDEFNQVKKILDQQKQDLVRLRTQLDEWTKQKEDLDQRVSEKIEKKRELAQLTKKRKSLSKDIEFAQFLRETYQKTRPLVTEILVEEISREADRIYRELRGLASEELAWKKDYEIVVYDQGNERAFHKLSGGEQMCAALSVRLAILKLLSTLDIVFLDEPTMNLDDEKKENLVAQLRELSGFSQIFVISHDETFESLTEHVITLEKKQGATRLLTHFQGGF